MGRSSYRHKSHRTRHIQVDNWRRKRSQQYMAHQPAKKILRMKITQERIYIQATRDQCSWSIKMVLLDNICTIMTYQCSWSIKMVLSRQRMYYYGFPRVVSNERAKELKRCLSPPMRVANKLTPKPKSKMAEIMPEHIGREQKSWKHAWARRWG